MQSAVESNALIKSEIKVERPSRRYIFIPDSNGILSKLIIVADVLDPEKFYSEIRHIPGKPTQMIIGKDDVLFDNLVREFQEIESLMSPLLGMRKVHWECAEYKVVPETEIEKDNVKIIGWNLTDGEPIKEIIPTSKTALESVINSMTTAQKLILPLSFYREGTNEFDSKRYINAFYNFYFVIEGLYGNRKTLDRQIRHELKKSPALRQVIEIVITDAEMLEKDDRKAISELLASRNKRFDVDGVIDLLVSTRGDLHHFTNNPNKLQGTPFTQRQFRPIAFLSMATCLLTLVSFFQLDGNNRV
jgi:hypothetical protein